MSTQRADRLLLSAGVLAIVVGVAASTILLSRSSTSPATDRAGSTGAGVDIQPSGGWKERSATKRRHEVLLRSFVAGEAWEKALEEATSLLQLDPFHDEARALRDRARAALQVAQASAEGDRRGGETPGTSSYERAKLEARKLVDSSIEARYPDPAVAAAVGLYALDGRLEQAIERIRKLQGERSTRSRASSKRQGAGEGTSGSSTGARELEELMGALVQVDAALQEGQGLLRKGRLADADEQLHIAITWDRQILPFDLGSVLIRDARRNVARAWLEDGKRHAARSQLSLAQASWRRGILADPSLLELRMIARRQPAD